VFSLELYILLSMRADRYSERQQLIRYHHRHHHSANRCPSGFIYSPATGTCYLLRGEQVTWDVADRHCRRHGAQLVTIQSSVEQRQLTELARANSGQHNYQNSAFLPRDAVHSANYAVARCLSVCPSHAGIVKTAKRIGPLSNFFTIG